MSQKNDVTKNPRTIKWARFQIIRSVSSNKGLKFSCRFIDFKQDEVAVLSRRGRKKNLNHPAKGKGMHGIGCLAHWNAVDIGNACQSVTSSAWWPERWCCRVMDILTGATVWRGLYANDVLKIMNSIIFSSSESFNGKNTWISLKSPHRGIKNMFYSFIIQTLSCVQISSFHCLQYLKEEQTAGSSLDASIEDFFFFFLQ